MTSFGRPEGEGFDMGKFIVRMQDCYLEWSTITDSPITFGMALGEFKEYYQDTYGRRGSWDLQIRLERADEHGSSAHRSRYWPPDLFSGNRAGPNESELTEDEIYKAYCLQEPIRDGWTVPCADELEI